MRPKTIPSNRTPPQTTPHNGTGCPAPGRKGPSSKPTTRSIRGRAGTLNRTGLRKCLRGGNRDGGSLENEPMGFRIDTNGFPGTLVRAFGKGSAIVRVAKRADQESSDPSRRENGVYDRGEGQNLLSRAPALD